MEEEKKTKVLIYHWDFKEQPELEVIQRAINAVFDGKNAPLITENMMGGPSWDQRTIAICSTFVAPDKLGMLARRYVNDEDESLWWEKITPPVPYEV